MSKTQRACGILLPIPSLPSPFGIGCFSKEAYAFVDFLQSCGQHYWQLLPLSPTSFGDSPYQSFSGFAGNPYLIDLTGLIEDGLLSEEECRDALGSASSDSERIDYRRQYEKRWPLLRLAYGRWQGEDGADYQKFVRKNEVWLEDYALFMSLKDRRGGASWQTWEEPLRRRQSEALAEARTAEQDSIRFYKFLQFRFFEEWNRLKQYANGHGIRFIGDLPLYVSEDSADVWRHPELFCLDENLRPTCVAGCPPDEFSPDGQLWGNPLYRWSEHRRNDYAWWLERLSHAFSQYDVVRLDHFRGFDAYYAVPYGAETAKDGHWEKGVGAELFRVTEEVLDKREIIAEDLGFITDSVRTLVETCGFYGMKILQFGFDGTEVNFSSDDLPHRYPRHCAAYTGTHDNPTLSEWIAKSSDERRARMADYLCVPPNIAPDDLSDALIGALMRSQAEICIVPMQDYLHVGEEGRINVPSVPFGNWQWRLPEHATDASVRERILKLCRIGSRSALP